MKDNAGTQHRTENAAPKSGSLAIPAVILTSLTAFARLSIDMTRTVELAGDPGKSSARPAAARIERQKKRPDRRRKIHVDLPL